MVKVTGGEVIGVQQMQPGDVPLSWQGHVVGAFRPPELNGSLARMLVAVGDELGAPLSEVSREQRQQAVRLLEERGAFAIRKSVDMVADALGVSRFTIYNYINRNNADAEAT